MGGGEASIDLVGLPYPRCRSSLSHDPIGRESARKN